MVREVITLQIGNGGLNVGCNFWDYIRTEHGLDPLGVYHGNSHLQLQYIDVYFQNVDNKIHFPRTILVGSDDRTIKDTLKQWRMYNPELQLLSPSTNNVFSKGISQSASLIPAILEKYRYLSESCDSLQGVQIIHSLGGGTGSAFTSKLLEDLHHSNSQKSALVTWSIFPSQYIHDAPTTAYNTILSLPYLVNFADITFCMDNHALGSIANNVLRIKPEKTSLNYILALAMAGTSATFRFPGQQNSDWRSLIVNIVPNPKLHFVGLSQAPIRTGKLAQYDQSSNVSNVIRQIFSPEYSLTSMNASNGRYLASALFLRGRVPMSEVDRFISQKNTSINKSLYIPDSIMRSVCDIPPPGMKLSGTLVVNNTAIVDVIGRELSYFDTMFKKRAFIHWYDGLEEEDFRSAALQARDLLKCYKEMGSSKFKQADNQDYDVNDW